eukprot:1738992-Pyramimonas_sp.AAC.1
MLPIVDVINQLAQNSEGHPTVDHKSDAKSEFVKQRTQYMKVGLAFDFCVPAPAKLVVVAMADEPQQALMQSASTWRARRARSSRALAAHLQRSRAWTPDRDGSECRRRTRSIRNRSTRMRWRT